MSISPVFKAYNYYRLPLIAVNSPGPNAIELQLALQ